ncbi:MAG: hypothetical protein KGJ62_10705 [Armatimonadetes bacterium]|nr:hypothetical protein [Armatimonadota bacterium]MDE2207727.1 hypothetical protein [Armatimonadota bacterium]
MSDHITAGEDLLMRVGNERYGTVLADPPRHFANSNGKMAPEHKRLRGYETLSFQEINDFRWSNRPYRDRTGTFGFRMRPFKRVWKS